MSVNVNAQGVVRTLDRIPEPATPLTEQDVQAPKTLVRLLADIIQSIAKLSGLWRPKRVDFEGLIVDETGTTKYRLTHGLNGPVRWWPVDWVLDATAFAALGITGMPGAGASLSRDSTSDSNTLVLVSYFPGTVTVRIEEAG